jgi:hypothetical protein
MSFAIALASLAIAALALARQVSPALDATLESWTLALSAAVMLVVVAAYAAAMRLAAAPVLE